MGRGKLSQETVRKRTLDKAAELLAAMGVSAEQVADLQAASSEKPAETRDDKLREAESVHIYFSTNGAGFKEKECKWCHKIFAYSWNVDSISFCSIGCAAESLKQIGIKWSPDKDQSERWGKYAPAVVPPGALEILKDQLNGFQEDLPSDTDSSE